jgi:hypothetical protein
MKVSNDFKKQITQYLDKRAETDLLFKPVYEKANKSIDECIEFIYKEVKKKAGSNNAIGLTDDEVYGMAVHYYQEDNIVVNKVLEEVKVVSLPKAETPSFIIDDDDDGIL